jgi:ABC-type phosphate transport system substrate-binding protein
MARPARARPAAAPRRRAAPLLLAALAALALLALAPRPADGAVFLASARPLPAARIRGSGSSAAAPTYKKYISEFLSDPRYARWNITYDCER